MARARDINDTEHRISSASGAFQRGMYHLYLLLRVGDVDEFGSALRMYQALFLLVLTMLLLDSRYVLTCRTLPRDLRDRSQGNPDGTTVDPAVTVKHAVFENPDSARAWHGFGGTHPLHQVSRQALDLLRKAVHTRHGMIYRPMLLAGRHWEDCRWGTPSRECRLGYLQA